MTAPVDTPLDLDDPADRGTYDRVAPPAVSPVVTAPGRYDLIAIGGGTAGLVAAGGAALLGARTALVERALMGGDCLVTGCVPSKALLAAAKVAHGARRADAFGISTGPVAVDFPRVMQRLREVRAAIATHDSVETFRARGVDVVRGDATFVGKDCVRVGERHIRFRRSVIATGARPRLPDVPGIGDCPVRTSDTFFKLTTLPRQLLVIGGGPMGCELGQAMARLGSTVTLVHRGPRLLPADDPDASQVVLEALRDDGVQVLLSTALVGLSYTDGTRRAQLRCGQQEQSVCADEILVAVGRTPNLEGLDLRVAGVRHDDRGVLVDRHQRTHNRRIYAAGDVTGGHQYTHAAYAEAEAAVLNGLSPLRRRPHRPMPHVTYTDPEVAHVGLRSTELVGRGATTLTVELADNDRAIIEGDTRGFARVHVNRRGKILAGTVVGAHAGECISELTLAMASGLSLDAIANTIHPYPTRSEPLRALADQWVQRRLTPGVRRALRGWFRTR